AGGGADRRHRSSWTRRPAARRRRRRADACGARRGDRPRSNPDQLARRFAERHHGGFDRDASLLRAAHTMEGMPLVEDVLTFLTQRMQIDAEWADQHETSFNWWPSSLAQRIWISPPREFQGIELRTAHIQTDL